MLKQTRYDYEILKKRTLLQFKTGCAPWEVHWILDAIDRTPGHILEIGTHVGNTAAEIAHAFPHRDLCCVDNNMPAYGMKLEEVGMNAKKYPNVQLVLEDSKVHKIRYGTGVIFIDGDHSWEGVKADTENALSYFRGCRGMIIWHDYHQEVEVMPYLDYLAFRSNLPIWHVQHTTLAFMTI